MYCTDCTVLVFSTVQCGIILSEVSVCTCIVFGLFISLLFSWIDERDQNLVGLRARLKQLASSSHSPSPHFTDLGTERSAPRPPLRLMRARPLRNSHRELCTLEISLH